MARIRIEPGDPIGVPGVAPGLTQAAVVLNTSANAVSVNTAQTTAVTRLAAALTQMPSTRVAALRPAGTRRILF